MPGSYCLFGPTKNKPCYGTRLYHKESSFGHNTFTRTRNLDGIPFSKSFKYDLEMISWTGGTIEAAATVYWYGFAGAEDK